MSTPSFKDKGLICFKNIHLPHVPHNHRPLMLFPCGILLGLSAKFSAPCASFWIPPWHTTL